VPTPLGRERDLAAALDQGRFAQGSRVQKLHRYRSTIPNLSIAEMMFQRLTEPQLELTTPAAPVKEGGKVGVVD
jgi:hypothetical protein